MGNDLNCTAKIIAFSFSLKHSPGVMLVGELWSEAGHFDGLVDLASRDVALLCEVKA